MKNINIRHRLVLILIGSILTGCKLDKITSSKKVGINKYIDQTEIDVRAWLSYYTWKLENEGIDSAKSVLPDSTAVDSLVWVLIQLKTNDFSKDLSVFTFQPLGRFKNDCNTLYTDCNKPVTCLSTCLDYPITGISHEQANEFCKWRTDVVNKNEIVKSDKRHVTFRLPSEEEWIQFARIGLTENEKVKGMRDSLIIGKNCPEHPSFHYNQSSCHERNIPPKTVSLPTCFLPDKNGVYGLWGNVSEMVTTKGISKGGNYSSYAIQCHQDSVQRYSKPEKWVGFRCIAITGAE
jgi:formylglycine-generating enzyme required for sulfatase activity